MRRRSMTAGETSEPFRSAARLRNSRVWSSGGPTVAPTRILTLPVGRQALVGQLDADDVL